MAARSEKVVGMVDRTQCWAWLGVLAFSAFAPGCEDEDAAAVAPRLDAGPDMDETETDATRDDLMMCDGLDLATCEQLTFTIVELDPCCAVTADGNVCGADLKDIASFIELEGCAPVDDEGVEDPGCGEAMDGLSIDAADADNNGRLDVPIEILEGNLSLAGCCRPDNTCGALLSDIYVNDQIGVVSVGLGCQGVSVLAPLFEGGQAPPAPTCDYAAAVAAAAAADGGADGG